MKRLAFLLLFITSVSMVFSQQYVTCPNCYGNKGFVCSGCGGQKFFQVWNPYYGCYVSQPCGKCFGYGFITCYYCKGYGVVIGNSSPSFRGNSYRGSCNVPSHNCKIFVNNGNNLCSNCLRNGFKCHIIHHNSVK